MINHFSLGIYSPHFNYVLFFLFCKLNQCVNMISRLSNVEIVKNDSAIGAETVCSTISTFKLCTIPGQDAGKTCIQKEVAEHST